MDMKKRGLIMNFEINKEELHKSYDEFMEKHKDLKNITLGHNCKIVTGTIPVSMIKAENILATTEQ